jgi:hypothetical protein
VIVAPEQPTPAQRNAELRHRSVGAIREAAATAELCALTCEAIASDADTAAGADPSGPHRDRAARARRRAAAERRAALGMWARAAALESAAH